MSDPASVNVAITITGLSVEEAAQVLAHTAAGATFTAEVTQPAIGGKRHTVRVQGLSVKGAKDLTAAVYQHAELLSLQEPGPTTDGRLRYGDGRPVEVG